MNTLSYILGNEREIKLGEEYYLGQLWDGDGDGEELLESGAIAIDDEYTVAFIITEPDEQILNTLVKITDIY